MGRGASSSRRSTQATPSLRSSPDGRRIAFVSARHGNQEVYRARDFAVTVRDRKSGFCLIDRCGQVSPQIPVSGPPRFVGDCVTGQPDARRVEQGTSVGYVDRYPAFFHGQDLNLTGLPGGRYVLVHRANPERTMREVSYSDDAASVLLELTWPNGASAAPRVSVLRRCETSERCSAR
jgi:Lysyl oxidase